MRPSRREFVKLVTASGISLALSRIAAAQVPEFVTRETLPGRGGWNPADGGAGRIDGVVKVTGAKLYPSDFRAADLPGWPASTSHAMLVRVADARHVYNGIDIGFLSDAAKPVQLSMYHNDFFNAAVSAGIVGIVAWLATLLAPIVGVLVMPRDRISTLRLYSALLLSLSFLIFGLTDMTFGYDLPTTLHAFLTAIVLGAFREPEPPEVSRAG